MRKGYVVHGPHPRDYSYTLNRQVRKLGLRVALSAKFRQNEIVVVEDLEAVAGKTKEVVTAVAARGWEKVMFVDGQAAPNEKLARAVRNVKHSLVLPPVGINVYDLLKAGHVVISRGSLEAIARHVKPVTRTRRGGLFDAIE